MPDTREYGEWPSPITADAATAATVQLGPVEIADGFVYWLERRPSEGGRGVVVRAPADAESASTATAETDPAADVTSDDVDVRTLVHEYGGGDFTVADGTLYFARFADQRLCRQPADGSAAPEPITPEPETERGLRYADFTVTPDGEYLYAVRERHEGDGTEMEAVNELVAVPTDGSDDPTVVDAGHDFYSFPRVSPDGDYLAWTTWDHPRMPWDGTELHIAEIGGKDGDGGGDDGGDGDDADDTTDATLTHEHVVLGGPEESIFQPSWDENGRLYAVSDRTGWWNLYRTSEPVADVSSELLSAGEPIAAGGADTADPAPPGWEPLRTESAEFGVPQWAFGLSTYTHLDDGRIAAIRNRDGTHDLGFLDPETGTFDVQDLPFAVYSRAHLVSDDGHLAFHGAGPRTPRSVVSWTPSAASGASNSEPRTLRRAFTTAFDESYLPDATHFSYPTGDHGEETAHAYYYPPTNPDVFAVEGDVPPLIVTVHGGPTSQTLPVADIERAYYTSRGFAVVDVNYRGSTGYGRAYRDALDGEWGIVDTFDCVAVARYLGHWGVVDPDRQAITGGSAGGYATLAALAFHDEFDAGASYYGVADLRALAKHTHKFESRYLDGLVGPLPEATETYERRSPAAHAEGIDAPLLALQGGEDRVVPPEQSEEMVNALVETGTPYAYVEFPEERHGFRDATARKVALETELGFYTTVFDLDRDDVSAVELDEGAFRTRRPTEE
jgi:dipeptidyl aminopeptidase/acylaminoacyl peptidase